MCKKIPKKYLELSCFDRPGNSRFEEKWLKDIIENKVIIIDQIDF